MASGDTEQSPWTRPGFIAAGLVVAIVLVLAVVLGLNAANNATADPEASADPTAVPTATQPSADPEPTGATGESVCGLDGVASEHAVTSTIPATWEFQGTIAYPTSPEFGPGLTDDQGIRACFQRSPQGAVVMAANALAQGSDPVTGAVWAESALGHGQYRDQLLGELSGAGSDATGSRLNIAGFRVLAYDGETATIDLGVRGSAGGQNITLSGVYELVWQDGDWKINADVRQPLDIATIPDLAGYISWGA
ncbi:hypothetical protein [Cellulomonas carbonis]|uniref:hypothetical protein n=1 Tax=Cellulomonas carbonis TaxID=1386092 RepID=UPI0016648A99|nr:hypothetical protein [Cellulomonas carbonis]GGC17750.1 hypothetical protein GCM10010972_33720 [Cellulomonas carbonis]